MIDDQTQSPTSTQEPVKIGESLAGTDIPAQVQNLPVTSLPTQDVPPTVPPQPISIPPTPPQPPQPPAVEPSAPLPPKKSGPSLGLTLLLILLVLTLTGLSFYLVVQLTSEKQTAQDIRSKATTQTTPSLSTPKTTSAFLNKAILLTINDVNISGETFLMTSSSIFPGTDPATNQEIRQSLENYFIRKVVLEEKAKQLGITITQQEIMDKMDVLLSHADSNFAQRIKDDSIHQEITKIQALMEKIKPQIENAGLDFNTWLEGQVTKAQVIRNY